MELNEVGGSLVTSSLLSSKDVVPSVTSSLHYTHNTLGISGPVPGVSVSREDLHAEHEAGHEAGGGHEGGPEGLEGEERGREADRGRGQPQPQPQEPDRGRGMTGEQPHSCKMWLNIWP